MRDIFLSQEALHWHTVFFGTTGIGRTALLTETDGIENKVPDRQIFWPATSTKDHTMNQEISPRDRAVREAYWSNSDMYEFHNIHDACLEYLGVELANEQVKAIFMAMPEDIVGSGLLHGFTDSVVRDDIGEYVREHADSIRSLLASAQSMAD